MARYIDADKLIDFIMEAYPEWCVNPIRQIFDYINSMPTADVQEIRHGKWVQDETAAMLNIHICSECRQPLMVSETDTDFAKFHLSQVHYCPNCGARMENEREGA